MTELRAQFQQIEQPCHDTASLYHLPCATFRTLLRPNPPLDEPDEIRNKQERWIRSSPGFLTLNINVFIPSRGVPRLSNCRESDQMRHSGASGSQFSYWIACWIVNAEYQLHCIRRLADVDRGLHLPPIKCGHNLKCLCL